MDYVKQLMELDRKRADIMDKITLNELGLSSTEKKIYQLSKEGLLYVDIAETVGLTRKQVELTLRCINHKFGQWETQNQPTN